MQHPIDCRTSAQCFLPSQAVSPVRSQFSLLRTRASLGITLATQKLDGTNVAGFTISVKREAKGSLITLSTNLTQPLSVKELYSIITSKPGSALDGESASALDKSGFSMPAVPTEISASPIFTLRFTLTEDLSRISTVSLKASLPSQLSTRFPDKMAKNITLGEMVWTFENPFTSGVAMSLQATGEWRLSPVIAFAVQVPARTP
jgi:hypothetical protein